MPTVHSIRPPEAILNLVRFPSASRNLPPLKDGVLIVRMNGGSPAIAERSVPGQTGVRAPVKVCVGDTAIRPDGPDRLLDRISQRPVHSVPRVHYRSLPGAHVTQVLS